MNRVSVKAAIADAKRFIKAAEGLIGAYDQSGETGWTCPKESGACRRASLDLTRTLAEMRKPM